MFERFKKTIEIHHKYDFLPQFDYENCTREELVTFLKSISRVQLLHLGDTLDFDEIESDLDLWNIFYEVRDWHGSWPIDDDVKTAMNSVYWDKDSLWHKYKNLDKEVLQQIEGMQKKIDKIEKLIENAEFKLCGKDAMKL